MLEHRGFIAGERDGYNDAVEGKRARPRPKLALCLIAQGYQDRYLEGYHMSYDRTKWALLQSRAYREQEKVSENRADELLLSKSKLDNRSREQIFQDRQGDIER